VKRVLKVGFVFHKLHITENTVGVPNNLLYPQNVFGRYTLKQWFSTGMPFTIRRGAAS